MEQAGLAQSLSVASPLRGPSPQVARAWAVGQVLSATVLDAGGDGRAALLRVGAEQVQARAQLPLEAGQVLRLQVTRSGPPALLQVVAPDATADAGALAARVLREVLPLQRPLSESLAALQRVTEQPHGRRPGDLPGAARDLLADLLASLPRPKDAGDGQRLAAMVRSSGVFHEAELAREGAGPTARSAQDGNAHAGADLKARVAAVAEVLRNAAEGGVRDGPAKETDSALRAVLARIETNQALSARAGHERGGEWRMDLPFADERGPHAVGMRVRREGASDQDAGRATWVVELEVQPPGSPPLHARVSLSDGAVHTLFTSNDAPTLARLEANGGELVRRLEGEDLRVGGVRWRRGEPPRDDAAGALAGLVDERA